jgi:phosphogluconate dehydratase
MRTEIVKVTDAIEARSQDLRDDYLRDIDAMRAGAPDRQQLSCGNLAHGMAACSSNDKSVIKLMDSANIGIVTAYNDMLSAHAPYETYPERIKQAARRLGSTAQIAGGVPAMCDGVTQGQSGMELSLFSRDVIAQATAVSLSHQMFDAALLLGVCDKIIPGLLMGALQFGHLPVMTVPAGPMPSGLPNKEKIRIRQLFAEGKVGREELLEAESQSYHSQGTCTFYGTANSNQVMVEAMGLQLPGSSFVNPDTQLRDALTDFAAEHVIKITAKSRDYRPMASVVDARALVNAMVALLASGGSTNLCIHLIAIARAAGYRLNWSDFDAVSAVTPLIARVYPNGSADVNHFHAAGGTGVLFRNLLDAGLVNPEASTCFGDNFGDYCQEPVLDGESLRWRDAADQSLDKEVLNDAANAFASNGGLKLLNGKLGRAVIKTSAVADEHTVVEAPAVVIDDQDALKPLFEAGELDRDCVVVVRYQGPSANGMPELHKLTPMLGVLQDKGYRVALVTDGRMSGASGKVPAAIHLTPEAKLGGLLGKVQTGDVIRLDANTGELGVLVDDDTLASREQAGAPSAPNTVGRGLFFANRGTVNSAEEGACSLFG